METANFTAAEISAKVADLKDMYSLFEEPLPCPERQPGATDVTIDSALPPDFLIPYSEEIRQLLEARLQKGVETYGTRLFTHNGRDALRDAIEELADALLYVTQAQLEYSDKVTDCVSAMKFGDILTVKEDVLRALSKLLEVRK